MPASAAGAAAAVTVAAGPSIRREDERKGWWCGAIYARFNEAGAPWAGCSLGQVLNERGTHPRKVCALTTSSHVRLHTKSSRQHEAVLLSSPGHGSGSQQFAANRGGRAANSCLTSAQRRLQ
eukprot:363041-Chlamydomonas_euryale.AAC.7